MSNLSKKTVVIVREGTWGRLTQEDKDRDVAMHKRVLETPIFRFRIPGLLPKGKEEQRADVEIVATTDDARKRLATHPKVDVVFFDSAVNIPAARALKLEYPKLTVVVLTGMIPKEEVLILNRDWFNGGEKNGVEMMQYFILDTEQG